MDENDPSAAEATLPVRSTLYECPGCGKRWRSTPLCGTCNTEPRQVVIVSERKTAKDLGNLLGDLQMDARRSALTEIEAALLAEYAAGMKDEQRDIRRRRLDDALGQLTGAGGLRGSPNPRAALAAIEGLARFVRLLTEAVDQDIAPGNLGFSAWWDQWLARVQAALQG